MINERNHPFWRRFFIYQKERFPFLAHGPLILMFTFSAISYSRISRGQSDFIDLDDFIVGFITTLSLFLLVRILDEHKDKETDSKFRKELPVPRGLISLKELRNVGFIVFSIPIVCILSVHPTMLVFYFIVIAYLFFMTVEFFAHDWLNANMWAYVGSHMIIIPLVDIYASGLDWYLDGVKPHLGLLFFFGVSYFNGVVLEVGRKLKAPELEKEGVVTYSGILGPKKGSWLWLGMLTLTAIIAASACYYAELSMLSYFILASVLLVCFIFAFRYMRIPNQQNSKSLEILSGIWTLLMYGTLGGIPGLLNIVSL